MASGGMEGLTPEAARSLVDSVDVFIFDCDGTCSLSSLLPHSNMWIIFNVTLAKLKIVHMTFSEKVKSYMLLNVRINTIHEKHLFFLSSMADD